MTSAPLEPAVPSRGRGPGRRAGRRKIAVLEAACRVIADRGADATRFADVAAESGVPVSTLQYYFGSREDLLVAAFRHASSAEIAALEAEVAGLDDPWDQLEKILTTSLTGYGPDVPGGGRLWIESWHFGPPLFSSHSPHARKNSRLLLGRASMPSIIFWHVSSQTRSSSSSISVS